MSLTPEYAPKAAEAAVFVGKEIFGYELDYTPASMAHVDHILDSLKSGSPDAESATGTLTALACYLGETIVRNLGGRWVATDETPMKGRTPYSLVVVDGTGSLFYSPFGRVVRRFENGEADSVAAFYESMAADCGASTESA